MSNNASWAFAPATRLLGHVVCDPLRLEGERDTIQGFGLLDLATEMTSDKLLREVSGRDTVTGARIVG